MVGLLQQEHLMQEVLLLQQEQHQLISELKIDVLGKLVLPPGLKVPTINKLQNEYSALQTYVNYILTF
jgi:hypothetical protein